MECESDMTTVEYRDFYDKRLEQNPNDVEALIERAFLSIDFVDEIDYAIGLLEHALKLEPTNVDALFWLAKIFVHCLCNREDARKTLTKALDIEYSRADCHILLAGTLKYLGDDILISIYHLKKAIELEPTWILPRTKLSRYYLQLGKVNKAEKEANLALTVFETLDFQNAQTPIQEYYEECIRGRIPKTKQKLEKLFKDIEKTKLKI